MSDLLDILNKNPEDIFTANIKSSDVLKIVKGFFDPIASKNSVLEEIYIDGLDASQVWGQAKLVLDGVNENVLFEQLPELKSQLLEASESGSEEASENSENEFESGEEFENQSGVEDDEGEETGSEEEFQGLDEVDEAQLGSDGELLSGNEQEDNDDDQEEEESTPQFEESTSKPEKDAFGLNDEFFDIDEFNRQTLAAENGEDPFDNDDDENINLFDDLDSEDDEEEEMPQYNDFFKAPSETKPVVETKPQPKSKKSKKQQREEEEEEENFGEEEFNRAIGSTMLDLFADEEIKTKPENLSTFEKQQKKMAEEIAKLEQESIAEKKWSMKGETKAKDRPFDSLLDEELEFERTSKPVPVITKEVTESLEEIIRRRIKDEEFDELKRRVVSDATKFKSSRFEVSESKSTKSLAELYEDEFNKVDDNLEISDAVKKSHDEITSLFQSLNHKLDALCSAHFIPKPAQKSIDIKVQTDTITMEDAQPLAMSTESSLAPQEIYKIQTGIKENEIRMKSGIIMSKDELTRDDKQRLRRANKRKRTKHTNNPDNVVKKSKKNEVIDTLSKSNITIIGNKGEKRDAKGNLKKDKVVAGSSSLKL